ncbi:MAG: tRNA (N(6)-L-threonylcarbamoyladenosine(37)-C(2))-methylthiotransferase [Candidatus Methanomethylophilaceae archaeon]|jgi:threonylcarbamoyladenosine tRNA methylthiotransferase CDKAL1
MKHYVESYGCTMNFGEGEQLSERMSGMGYSEAESAEEADIVILNTCTVVEATEKKMVKRMTELRNLGKEVIVTGCMAEVQPGRIAVRLPGSLVITPKNYSDFSEKVGNRYGQSAPSEHRKTSVSAILPVAQGCLGACTYCITRFARGKLKSYPEEELIKEFRKKIDGGAKEILITSQDTVCYGADSGTDLSVLLKRMLEKDGDYRVRIGMMNPCRIPPVLDGLLEVFEDPRVYRFLHIPLQSGSDDILKAMGRGYTAGEYIELVKKIRSVYPDMSISTDMITGFPGETEEDHRMSAEILKKLRADTVNITRFSPRPGTKAAEMEQVNGRIAKERSAELTEIKNKICLENNRKTVGKTFRILVTEKGKDGSVIARTDSYRPVGIAEGLPLGTFAEAEITGCKPTHLIGKIVI